MAKNNNEIERRWLLDRFPLGLAALPSAHIIQVYSEINAEGSTRFRKTEKQGVATYHKTSKTYVGHGENNEREHECSADEFNHAFISGGPYVIKNRYHYPWSGYTFEIDLFDVTADQAARIANQDQLVIMEVELPRIDAPVQLPRLNVTATEITGIRKLSNAQIAQTLAEMRSQ